MNRISLLEQGRCFVKRRLPIATLLLSGLVAHAQAADLQALDVVSLPGGKVELKLAFDEPAQVPKGYTIEQPARIALDFPGVANRLGVRQKELGDSNARSVTIVEAQGRSRVIVNLTALVPYTTRAEGNNLFVTLAARQAESRVVEGSMAELEQSLSRPSGIGPAADSITDIDFQRASGGAGNVVISLSDQTMQPIIEERGGQVVVRFAKATLPDPLKVRLDVQDFATPVRFVDSMSDGRGVRIAIQPDGDYEYMAFQTDDKLTVSVKPITEEVSEEARLDKPVYEGEKLSLNFQDIEVRSVLQLIADFTNLNLVASDTVKGNITLRLQNVPWDQALDLILKTKGLDKRQNGNVLLVAPASEIAARERQELEAQRQLAELAPLRRDVIQVNYAKASDIAKLFQSVSKSAGGGDDRGTMAVDDRTNNIIAYQTQDRLDELRRIVAQLDIPVRQVMIEARIVEASVGYDQELGVKWSGGKTDEGNFTFGGAGGDRTTGTGNVTDAVGTFVDMGSTSATSTFGIGFVTDNMILDLELSAMESTGNGEVVSQPKVLTADKETATITKGTEIPYQEASSSGATSTSFKNAALELEVTPQITPDNRVIMEVKVSKNAPDYTNLTNGVPPIETNELEVTVLINDGETIVIGGVYSNTQETSVDKVPVLGDLPYVGRLFRRDVVKDSKEELLIFLTPRILNSQSIAVR